MPRRSARLSLWAASLVSMLALPAVVLGQTGASGGEWRYYGGDAGGTRYAPLDQIDRDNVADLEIKWRWSAANFGASPGINSQVTPLMVDGVLYATAGTRRNVVAIDAATGETLWMWRIEEGDPRRGRAAQEPPRRRLLDRRYRRTHHLHHTRIPSDLARRPDRPPRPGVRRGGHRRSLRWARPAAAARRPHRGLIAADDRRRRCGDRRRAERFCAQQGEHRRVRARLRRLDRRAAVDLPHGPALG